MTLNSPQNIDLLEIFSLNRLEQAFPNVSRLPYSLKILLENLLRHEDARFVHARDIEALAGWKPGAQLQKEISFAPARVRLALERPSGPGGPPRGELIARGRSLDQSPDQPAPAQRKRWEHVLAAVAADATC